MFKTQRQVRQRMIPAGGCRTGDNANGAGSERNSPMKSFSLCNRASTVRYGHPPVVTSLLGCRLDRLPLRIVARSSQCSDSYLAHERRARGTAVSLPVVAQDEAYGCPLSALVSTLA